MNTAKTSGILVYIQAMGERINPVSIELIGEAHRLARHTGEDVCGVLVGHNTATVLAELEPYSLAELYCYDFSEYQHFIAYAYKYPFSHCLKQMRPSIVLIGATVEGRALAPAVATHIKTGLTADCTELSLDEEGNLVQTRPAYGGNIMARICTKKHRPQMATVRRGVMKRAEKITDAEMKVHYPDFSPPPEAEAIQMLRQVEDKDDSMLETAPIVFAVGRGVEQRECIGPIEQLAKRLGAEVGCSRGMVERGWFPVSRQIGLSGKAIQPELLVTFGVSGSVQFLAGISAAKKVIAINTDEQAPIFRRADTGILVDVEEIIKSIG